MPIQPWYVSQTAPDWKITLSVPGNPTSPDLTSLTTANLAMVVVDTGTNAISNALGTFQSIQSYVNPAVVVFRPDPNDLFVLGATTPKLFRLYVQVTYSSGIDLIGPYLFTTTPL
jgi:hypothetical protein